MSHLPDDVWYLIASFTDETKTLFNMAMTSRTLCDIVLPRMYRVAPKDRIKSIAKPTVDFSLVKFWNIVLQSRRFGKTMYNYATFLRVFDVVPLRWFLESMVKDASAIRMLFANGNSDIWQSETFGEADVPILVDRIAAHLLPHCKNIVELLSEPEIRKGHFLDEREAQFARWLVCLPKLRRLRIFDSTILTQLIRTTLSENCPALVELDICGFDVIATAEADDIMDKFLDAVPRMWQSVALRPCAIGNKTLTRLSQQSGALKHLEIWGYPGAPPLDWALLTECHELQSLTLSAFDMQYDERDKWYTSLDAFFNGRFPQLRTLILDDVSCAIQFAVKQLMVNAKLEYLVLGFGGDERLLLPTNHSEAVNTMELLCTGLAHQKSMESFAFVNIIPEEHATEAANQLTAAIVQMRALRNLQLGSSAGPCGYFTDSHIISICSSGLPLKSFKLASFMLTNRGMEALERMKTLTRFECVLPCHADTKAVLRLVKANHTLTQLSFVGHVSAKRKQKIDDILRSRGGRFTTFATYMSRNDFGIELDN